MTTLFIHRISFRRGLLVASASPAAIALLISAPAAAQSATAVPAATQVAAAAADDAGAIVVTGFRGSLRTVIDNKRMADRIVESVSAEDIGKLPDNSIADAISRLPGLTTQRLDGRSQVISIRGFAPDFSTTLLNGREQVTTGDNRSVEYDQYPAEIMSQVVVYKTPDASLVGQGLSGTVDLQTIKPLSYGKRVFTVSGRGEYVDSGKLNSGSKDKGYRFSGLYVDQFADGKVGVMLGAAYTDSPTQIQKFNAWGYPNADANNAVIGGSKSYVDSTELKRTAVIGAIEFKPTDNFTLGVDGYYSKFKDNQVQRGIELPLFWSAAQLQPGYTASNGLVTDGTYRNVKGVVRNDANRKDADLYSFGVNGKYENEAWTAVGDISWSKINKKELVLETYSGTGRGFVDGVSVGATDTIGFHSGNKGTVFSPTLNYSDTNLIKLTSPQGWGGNVAGINGGPGIIGGQDGYYNNRTVKDELYAFRGSLERHLEGAITSIQVGANYTTRKKSLSPDEYFLGLKGNTDGLTSVAIPQNLLLAPTNLTFLGLGPMVSYDPITMLNSGIYNLVRNPNADVNTKGWVVREKLLTGWVMVKLDTPMAGGRLTGNIGVQVVHADQSSTGLKSSGSGAGTINQAFTDGAKYTDVLPSANLSLRLDNDIVVRLGAAREVIRPRLDDMRSSLNISFSSAANIPGSTPWGGDGGYARLRPWRANAVDVSVEKYFGKDGYLAGAFFFKGLENYIYQAVLPFDFTGFPTPGGVTPVTNQGFVKVWQNGNGGKLYGWEGSGALPFNLMSSSLDGFGVTGSLSYTISKVSASPGAEAGDLPGYSKWVANATVYFEKAGFSARASLRNRSSYVGELRGFGGGNVRARAAGETTVDAQIGYEFQQGPLKGLSILAQGQNLTNSAFKTFNPGHPEQVLDYQTFGRRYLLGASFKY